MQGQKAQSSRGNLSSVFNKSVDMAMPIFQVSFVYRGRALLAAKPLPRMADPYADVYAAWGAEPEENQGEEPSAEGAAVGEAEVVLDDVYAILDPYADGVVEDDPV
eukprot:353776-Amphidinium_carterae.1